MAGFKKFRAINTEEKILSTLLKGEPVPLKGTMKVARLLIYQH